MRGTRLGSLNIQNLFRDEHVSRLRTLHTVLTSYESRPTEEQAIEDLCAFISREEGIRCFSVEIGPKGGPLQTSNVRDIGRDIDDFNRLWKETLRIGRPVAGQYRVLVPVLGKLQPINFLERVLVVRSESRIYHDQVLRIVEYIQILDRFFNRDIKMHVYTDLQNRVIKEVRAKARGNMQALTRSYCAFVDDCLAAIIDTTRADSATVRLYNPLLRRLELFSEKLSPWGIRASEKDRDISINAHARSANAFCFCNSSLSPLYIPNMCAAIPHEYVSLGLQSVLMSHRSSRTELCFALRVGTVPFGTLNVESRMADALSEDMMFLDKIKTGLETYNELIRRASDAKWMAASGLLYMSLHKLKNKKRDGFFTPEQEILLEECITPDRTFDLSDAPMWLDDIKSMCEEVINENSDSISRGAFSAMLRWRCHDRVRISKTVFDAVFLIAKSFIENVIDHGDKRRDTVTIATDPWPFRNVIQIKTKTFNVFSESDSNLATIAPIYREETMETHYGLFFVGMIARLTGGAVWFSRHPRYPYTMIEVVVPMQTGAVDAADSDRCL